MSVQVQWDNDDHTVLRYDVQGHWTWNEFYESFAQARTMLQTVSNTVDFIVNPADFRSRGYIPSGMISRVVQLYRSIPPNTGSTVIVGGGDFFRIINNVSRGFYPRIAARYHFTDTLDEARALLAQLRENKPT